MFVNKYLCYLRERLLDFVCSHELSRLCIENLRTAIRNFDSELPLFQLTFLTMTTHCSSTSSVSSKTSKMASKSSPHKIRPFVLSAILNEPVHGQSHVTGLFNIGYRAIV